MVDAGVTDMARCVDAMEETLVLVADGDYRMAVASAVSQRPSLKNLKVKGRSEASTKRSAEWFESEFPQLNVSVATTGQDAIEGSDIVVTAASTPKGGPQEFPYVNRAWLKPGAPRAQPRGRAYRRRPRHLGRRPPRGRLPGSLR